MMNILKPTQSIGAAMDTARQVRSLSSPGKMRAAAQRGTAATRKTPSISQPRQMTWQQKQRAWDERQVQKVLEKEEDERKRSLMKNGKELIGTLGKGLKATAAAADDLTR